MPLLHLGFRSRQSALQQDEDFRSRPECYAMYVCMFVEGTCLWNITGRREYVGIRDRGSLFTFCFHYRFGEVGTPSYCLYEDNAQCTPYWPASCSLASAACTVQYIRARTMIHKASYSASRVGTGQISPSDPE